MGETGPLRWRHNGCNGVLNHQFHDCLLSRLFRRRSKKTSKLRVTGGKCFHLMTSSFHIIILHLQWTKLANIITLWKTIIQLLVVYGSKRHETCLKMGSPSYLYMQEDITGCSLQNPTCLKTPDEVHKFMNMQIKWRYPHQSQTLFYKTNRNQIFEIILSTLTLHHFISTILIVEMKRTFHTHTTTHTDIQYVPRCIDIYKYFYAFLTHVTKRMFFLFCFLFFVFGGVLLINDDVTTLKRVSHYWPSVRGFHWSPCPPRKVPIVRSLMFSLL